ncbi:MULTISPECIES: tetratricopeptide repeat protein [unclassified Caballeronia]|uniref:tetratricopeptide repeat protein n=1 Tax=unclassified Caballeronia TaxID=2646786 RepID=UPI00286433F9|nr:MULTISPECIES: tetratricopeptide repeat protein [unclassified Caballeronia]MDR5774169.1 tetratricopeptide repeat protein [Caballeronia sp. LZ002]MDR5849604.1 tetratricopeptide repeat protein [Caballeronia sp. LZ003]
MPQTSASPSSIAAEQLRKWLGFLEQDPTNPSLLQLAASSAFDAGKIALCEGLIERCASLGALSPAVANLQGLVFLSQENFEEALKCLTSVEASHQDPVVRYNMAYAHAMLEQYDASAALLDETVVNAVPAAATLAVRVAHHRGDLEGAMTLGERHARGADSNAELFGALASVYFDADRLDAARRFALLAPDEPDSLTVLGLLELQAGAHAEASELFSRALLVDPSSARAMLGMGLCQLARQDFEHAAINLDSAALGLKRHAGSWVASAWAHLYNADLITARARFEHAAILDRGLAEAPGGLAVIACREQRLDEAKSLVKTALRLDRKCLAAALASSMLAAQAGDPAQSDAIMQRALSSPFDADGKTLVDLISRHSLKTIKDGY